MNHHPSVTPSTANQISAGPITYLFLRTFARPAPETGPRPPRFLPVSYVRRCLLLYKLPVLLLTKYSWNRPCCIGHVCSSVMLGLYDKLVLRSGPPPPQASLLILTGMASRPFASRCTYTYTRGAYPRLYLLNRLVYRKHRRGRGPRPGRPSDK